MHAYILHGKKKPRSTLHSEYFSVASTVLLPPNNRPREFHGFFDMSMDIFLTRCFTLPDGSGGGWNIEILCAKDPIILQVKKHTKKKHFFFKKISCLTIFPIINTEENFHGSGAEIVASVSHCEITREEDHFIFVLYTSHVFMVT
ncbi:hypothetical protein T05_1052 [Trichinella murrelli]|uniref:Uncharacterized protein n=1 Tax=Trichinella murrelli TaxID=144512 RepID=A0A0V0UI79_9BILA|nr:hypothetical protein T05_1052 [Trichinella murrelli]